MRYKQLISDKIVSVNNGLNTLSFHFERGERNEFRAKMENLKEQLEEIQTLINTNNNSDQQ